jgi:hypothetical protein
MPEEEEIELTRNEKILASAFVIFLLIGGVRIMSELKQVVDQPDYSFYEQKQGVRELDVQIQQIMEELRISENIVTDVLISYQRANEDYLFRREEYRVSLEEGKEDAQLESEYLSAKEIYEQERLKLQAAQNSLQIVQVTHQDLQEQRRQKSLLAFEEFQSAYMVWKLKTLGLRLLYAVPVLLLSIYFFNRARTRKSKYLILGNAFLAFGVLQFIFLILEHVWTSFHVIGIAFVGALITGGALVYLKKDVLSPERVSVSRIKQNHCPYCNAPIRGEYCFSCGRHLTELCPECQRANTVFSPYCKHCGAQLRK